MVAVLVDSRKDGETAWIATRGLSRFSVSGLSGCHVVVGILQSEHEILVNEDGEYDLPPDAEMVKVVHRDACEDSRVFVDLIRG